MSNSISNTHEFLNFLREKKKEYPKLRDAFSDIYVLTMENIDEGRDEGSEISKALQSVKDLISEEEE